MILNDWDNGCEVTIKVTNQAKCPHTGDYEAKHGGYVCLECFEYIEDPRLRVDKQTNKIFVE